MRATFFLFLLPSDSLKNFLNCTNNQQCQLNQEFRALIQQWKFKNIVLQNGLYLWLYSHKGFRNFKFFYYTVLFYCGHLFCSAIFYLQCIELDLQKMNTVTHFVKFRKWRLKSKRRFKDSHSATTYNRPIKFKIFSKCFQSLSFHYLFSSNLLKTFFISYFELIGFYAHILYPLIAVILVLILKNHGFRLMEFVDLN